MKWTAENEVYVPEIDDEHREIFRLTQDLQEAADAGANARVRALFKQIVEHADRHFKHEERLMRASGYPSYALHKRQHDGVRAKLEALAPRVRRGDKDSALLLVDYLCGWLRDHTSTTDRMMGAYLRANRRQSAAAS
jgi:hemerythrin